MVTLDQAVLGDPARLAAVDRALRSLSAHTVRMDSIARLAARLLVAPIAALTLVTADEEHFAGIHGAPESLVGRRRLPLEFSLCKYIVCADHTVSAADLTGAPEAELREHPLAIDFGIRAFLGVPIRDRDDQLLGSLTVLDHEPRTWTDDQVATLVALTELLDLPAIVPEQVGRGVTDSEALLRVLLPNLSVGVVVCDATGRMVLENRAMREVRGLPPGLPGDDYPEIAAGILYDAELRPMPWEQTPLMRALRGERVVGADVFTVVPGHRTRVFATTAQRIVDERGEAVGAVAICHEVTALRRAEAFRACHLAVEQALKQHGSVRDSAPHVLDAVVRTLGWPCAELFLIDETTGALRSVGHSDATNGPPDDFFGHTPIRGQGITGRVWETGRAIWVPDIAASTQLRSPYERERVAVCIRRGIRTVLAVPVRDGGGLLGVLTCYAGAPEHHEDLLTVLLDGVAAQIGVYVALQRAEGLARQLARAQNDFIDLIGHELRTPLTAVVANATMLAEDAAGLDPESRQMAHSIARNGAMLQSMADKLLELAGLDAGHIGLNVRTLDFATLVADAVAAARPGADLEITADLPALLQLSGDPDRLRDLVDDLLANAVKYGRTGGQAHVSLHADETTAELRIADDGIGMPEQERARAFDRFYRGSNVRHQGTVGSGLGLSLARTIALLHHGTIKLTENRPHGTVVIVRLPLGHRSQSLTDEPT